MKALFLKEVRVFLSSLIGYVVMAVFLLITGLFLWVFPGDTNILDMGFASMDSLFFVTPWVFIFLIPAITMRSFSEERRTGTIELLLTKPLSEWQIVLAKYGAGLLLVWIALLPTLVYYITIYQLGNPAGNLDSGGIWGSYLGLFFLASAYVAIGLFCSSLTDNQIIAFLAAALLSFVMYSGFQSIANFDLLGSLDSFVSNLGMQAHFNSLGRGVVDTRDVVYFLIITYLFLLLSRLVLLSRKW
jgi:ABC-2 type transport system permease protein